MELVLSTCVVRDWRSGDEMSLVRFANNANVSRNLRDAFPYPYTMADARIWIDGTLANPARTAWAIVVDGHAVGGVGLRRDDDVNRISAEIGYWLGEEYWGRGIATEAVGAVTQHGFDALGLVRIYAAVFDGNPASVRVLEKNGFEKEGFLRKSAIKAGRVVDQLLYARVRNP